MDAQDKRITAILGKIEDSTFDETIDIFFEYLKTNLLLPCEVTGIEDFRWEEIYLFGGIDREGTPEWMMFWEDDIGAHVRRISDGKKFLLGLSELKATDKISGNYQLLDDYSVWFVNNR